MFNVAIPMPHEMQTTFCTNYFVTDTNDTQDNIVTVVRMPVIMSNHLLQFATIVL